jgi:hypothetical protein
MKIGHERPDVRRSKNGLLAALAPWSLIRAGLERRREVRYPTNDPVQVRIRPGEQLLPGTILDISKSGLRIELSTPVARDSRVEIILPTQAVVFGTVRYCRRVADAYHAGVVIDNIVYVKPPLPVQVSEEPAEPAKDAIEGELTRRNS